MQTAHSRKTNSDVHIPLRIYLLVTFGIAWLIWLPLLIAEYLQLSLSVPSIVFITLGSFAPSIVALFITWRYAGGTALRQLLGRVLVWRISPAWYALAIVSPAIVMLLAISGHILLGGTMPDYAPFGARWLVVPVNLVLVFLIGGPLGEEFGWRGVVLPALEARFRPPWDSLILGIIWTAWHLPLFFISASAQHSLPFWLFALLTMPLCILITWVYHCSKESLLLVMLFHAAVNTWSGVLKISPEAAGSARPLTLVVLLTWVVALFVIFDRKRVTTKRPSNN